MSTGYWRAKYVRIRLSPSRQLQITLRRFRTNKARRRQFVVPLQVGKVKEIAISSRRSGGKKAQPIKGWQQAASHLLLTLGLTGVIFCSAQAVHVQALEPPQTFTAVRQTSVTRPAAKPQPQLSLPAAQPTNISIPAQSIAAPIISVGQAADGSIQTPPPLDWSVGWYDKSPTPGQIGPSVVVGHVDSTQNISVFWRLRYLQAGDIIKIGRADGSTATFSVDSLQQFDQNNFPTRLVYGNTARAELRLITCGGTFNESTQSYTQNTVVFAHLIK